MAVSAETGISDISVDMALVTEITVIIVPRTLGIHPRCIFRMNPRVSPLDTVKITVTSGQGAGRVVIVMAGCAIFDIIFSGFAVIGQPR